MARIATAVFGSITSISEVAVTSLGAKGLCLHKSSGTRSFSSKSVAVTLKKEPRQLKTTHRKNLDKLQSKNRKIHA
jgi:hypothetical protein